MERPFLHGEFKILRFVKRCFEPAAHRLQLRVNARQPPFQFGIVGDRVAAGDDVLTLAIETEIEIELRRAGRGIARKTHPRSRSRARRCRTPWFVS
ncbi:MAG: hypothetical protein WDN04_17235 [Rhodospirillales bacterium]